VTHTFADLGVPADLAADLTRRGITAPFPIQSATLPDALAGRDVSGRAPTGSGKTIAFGLAVALRVGKASARRPRALVLVPTRELADQVRGELSQLVAGRGRSVASVYGGTGYGPQRRALQRGVDILVACPGRLEDLIACGDVKLDEVELVVIDEADRMADMGFLPAVRRLLDVLVKRYQRDPRRHEVDADEGDVGDVRHVFWRAERADRVDLTASLIGRHAPSIVFSRTRHGADRIVRQLRSKGVESVAIHGNRTQPQRERALKAFSDGTVATLVATDVAARGIHVDDVSCVIHFDPPADHKDYLHRSGRTGRAGADGIVVSLVGEEQRGAVRAIQAALGLPTAIDRPDLDGISEIAPSAVATVAVRPAPPQRQAPARRGQSSRRGGPGARGRR
jgi:superfamily II DNA/RNA helicase